MSNRRKAKRRHVDRETAIGWGEFSRAVRGCTCNADTVVTHPEDGITMVNVLHDDWCPVLAHERARHRAGEGFD